MCNKQLILTVIITYYNEIDYINTAIKQVLENNIELEIIIIDDCSDKKLENIIQNNFLATGKITIIRNEKNSGQIYSILKGIEIAKGNFVHLFDADDFLEAHTYDNIFKGQQILDYDIIQFPAYLYNFNNELQINNFCEPVSYFYKSLFLNYLNDYNNWNIWNKLYKLKVLKRAKDLLSRYFYCFPRNATDYLLSFCFFMFADSYHMSLEGKYIKNNRNDNVTSRAILNPKRLLSNNLLALFEVDFIYELFYKNNYESLRPYYKYKYIFIYLHISAIYNLLYNDRYYFYKFVPNLDIKYLLPLENSLTYNRIALFDYFDFFYRNKL